ncbi:hypothetical protein ACGFNU_11370 [Spirillospora sp. NPDC048911]|uniref:hypothetical protein n=1 Tax=Spirillospora sp. NPDC048911 TaxID=3364527 RepID=UPI003713100B
MRQSEWDAIITDQPLTERGDRYLGPTYLEPHLFALFIAPVNNFAGTIETQPNWIGDVDYNASYISNEIMRIKGLPERIAQLTHEELEPVLKERQSHTYFYVDTSIRQAKNAPGDKEEIVPTLTPFIATPTGRVLAGRYKRGEKSEAWLIPDDAPNILLWARAAFAEWHRIAPDRFPGIPDWSRESRWMTPEEQSIQQDLDRLTREREVALLRFATTEDRLRQQLQEKREQVDSYERALLTTQSNNLEEAVGKVLRELGFDVENADESASPGDNLEDLHIRDTDHPDWIAIAEVKGYSKGAKTEAITQFIRFGMRYQERTKRTPNAFWYIVNQFMARDPSTRPLALNGKDEDVAAFASAGGLVIDTITLFDLVIRVREDRITAAGARDPLRNATGRFTLSNEENSGPQAVKPDDD